MPLREVWKVPVRNKSQSHVEIRHQEERHREGIVQGVAARKLGYRRNLVGEH